MADIPVRNFSWSAVGRFFREFLNLILMLIMARYLVPEDFGAYALLMLFINLVSLFGIVGTSQILIMREFGTDTLASELFYLNVVIGLLAYTLVSVGAAPLATWFEIPSLASLLPIAGLAFVLQVPIVVQRALMEREMRFASLIKVELGASLVASLISLLCLAAGLGVLSLIVFQLATLILTGIGLFSICPWRPGKLPNPRVYAELLPTLLDFVGFSLLNFLTRNVDVFLIGRFLGSAPLGIYAIAYRIAVFPVLAINQVVHRVSYPSMVALREHPEKAKAFYLQVLEVLAVVSFPAFLGLAAVSDHLIGATLGRQWHDAAPLVRVLACTSVFQLVTGTIGTIYPAFGRTRLMFHMGVLNTVAVVLAFVLAIDSGLYAVAIAYLAANVLMFGVQVRVAWPLLALKFSVGSRALLPAVTSSVFMVIIISGFNHLVLRTELDGLFALVLAVSLGVMAYLFSMWVFFRETAQRVLAVLLSQSTDQG